MASVSSISSVPSVNYITELPRELIYTIIGYTNIKKDLENLFEILGDKFMWDFSWGVVGNELYPGKNIKTKKDFYLHSLKTDLYSDYYYENGEWILGEYRKMNFYVGQIKIMSSGARFTIIVNTDNEIYILLLNVYDKENIMGVKVHAGNKGIPIKINHDIGEIKEISCWTYHAAIINEKGELYLWGNKRTFVDGVDRIIPTKVEGKWGKIVNVSCGNYTITFLTENGDIYGWGNLGFPDGKTEKWFTFIENVKNVKKLINGGGMFGVLYNDGHLIFLAQTHEVDSFSENFYNIQSKSDFVDIHINDRNMGIIRNKGIVSILGPSSVEGYIFKINNFELYVDCPHKILCNNKIFILTKNNLLHIIHHPNGEIVYNVIDITINQTDDYSIYLKYV